MTTDPPNAHHRAFAVSLVSSWIVAFSRRCISIWHAQEGMLGPQGYKLLVAEGREPLHARTFTASTSRRNGSFLRWFAWSHDRIVMSHILWLCWPRYSSQGRERPRKGQGRCPDSPRMAASAAGTRATYEREMECNMIRLVLSSHPEVSRGRWPWNERHI